MSDMPIVSGSAARASLTRTIVRFAAKWGLLWILLSLIVLFALLLPDTFPTALNARTIVSDKTPIALASLAVMIPLAANEFDLSIGSIIALTHVLSIGLQTRAGLSWPIAVLICLCVGAAVGAMNGFLVGFLEMSSFIATIGTGSIVLAVTYWYTGGLQVYGDLPNAFRSIALSDVLSAPPSALMAVGAAVVLWVVFEYTSIGRRTYALGSNRRAAELVGVSYRHSVLGAFMASGLLTALAGVALGAQLGLGQASTGPDYLLPAFVGALLGATVVRPGRVNAAGTLIAVAVLAVGISGLQQLGASFFVEPLFNGVVLIVAIALVSRRTRGGN